MTTRTACGAALLLTLLLTPTAHAQDRVVPEPDLELRLDGWLRLQSEREHTRRLVSGAVGLSGGALVMAGGLVLPLLRSDEDPGYGTVTNTYMLTFGSMMLGLGIFELAVSRPAEERYQRWRAARRSGLDAGDLGRFEGELRASVHQMGWQRSRAFWMGLGLAVGGGTAFGLSFLSSLDEIEQTSMRFAGGVMAGTGLVLAVLTMIETEEEGDLRDFDEGLAPVFDGEPGIEARVVPTLLPDGAGATIIGTF